ncbi:hypothetical protein D3C83_188590 [compost metagenome]
MVQGTFDHFPGVNTRAVNGAAEELFETDDPVPVVQEQAGKNFMLVRAQPRL